MRALAKSFTKPSEQEEPAHCLRPTNKCVNLRLTVLYQPAFPQSKIRETNNDNQYQSEQKKNKSSKSI
eukprot:1549401-Amphidinium_carterae.1